MLKRLRVLGPLASARLGQTATILAEYSKLPVERVQHMRREEYATTLAPALLQTRS